MTMTTTTAIAADLAMPERPVRISSVIVLSSV
jgi:hypothetical protein